MAKYVKKPVEIEAVVYKGGGLFTETPDWLTTALERKVIEFNRPEGQDRLFINTLEGVMKGSIGDFIVRGVCGEIYACKPDIFEKTYDPVPDHWGV